MHGKGWSDLIFVYLIISAFWIFPGICFQRIAQKTKTTPNWLAWIPIANLILLCRLARASWWWVLLCLIPYLGIIFIHIILYRIPKTLGVTGGTRILAIVPFLNCVYFGYLAFRKESQDGANASLVNQALFVKHSEINPDFEYKTSEELLSTETSIDISEKYVGKASFWVKLVLIMVCTAPVVNMSLHYFGNRASKDDVVSSIASSLKIGFFVFLFWLGSCLAKRSLNNSDTSKIDRG